VQSYYAASFDREMGCTEREWLAWLPRAVGAHALTLQAGRAGVAIDGGGMLDLRWTTLPPRQIALARFPRLAVQFRFDGVADEARQHFMRYFDLAMQRGGG
jgi:hypothetical protein